MDGEGCNDGATPQEQQTEAQQQDGNGCNDGTTPQEQQTEAQQHDGNGSNNGTTPQEQQTEAQAMKTKCICFQMMNLIASKLNWTKTLF